MTKLLSKFALGSLIVCTLGFAGGASAQSSVWDYGAACNPSPCNGNPVPTLANVSSWGTSSTSALYTQANSNNQNGLGVGAQFDPETSLNGHHAFDNNSVTGGKTNEVMLIKFDGKVNLNQIRLGWISNDADVLVYRWDGMANPTGGGLGSLAGTDALKLGWTLVKAMDVDTDGVASGVYTGGNTAAATTKDTMSFTGGGWSSWWLVSTYFSGAQTGTSQSAVVNLETTSLDYFKVLSFTGNVCASGGNAATGGTLNSCGTVSEPASLALAGLALFGIYGTRRKLTRQ